MDVVAYQLLALFNRAKLDPARAAEVKEVVRKIMVNLPEYQKVTDEMGSAIPAWFIGCLHYREQTSLSLKAFLGNGQLIVGTGRKSTIVPLGLGPFATFHEGAIVACRRQGLQNVRSWETGTCLEEAERWNGLGYRRLGVINPYLFAGTSLYHSGKFIADGHYSASAIDAELGVAALMLELQKEMQFEAVG